MSAKKIKGNLLEFIVRQLLHSCGFRSTVPDGHYLYKQSGSGLFFINGKGAAHDADVLMNPPIQIPFSYPSRVLFECKAYKRNVGLGVIRGALGLRYDINEFEIVTEDSIKKRKNNKRATYAVSSRNRYNYQVGVAAVEKFTNPGFEYAANNKIPLISLSWFLPKATCDLFHQITKTYIDSLDIEIVQELKEYLGSREVNQFQLTTLDDFISRDQVIGSILTEARNWIDSTYIGLNEYGDLFFLFPTVNFSREGELVDFGSLEFFNARIHYWGDEPGTWYLSLGDAPRSKENGLKFYLPDAYMQTWAKTNLDRNEALNIKQRFFSRIYLFGAEFSQDIIPFRIVGIDESWIDELRNR